MGERELMEKRDRLEEVLRDMGSVAVALSGGVDSTLLAKVAHEVLGDAMVAATLSLRSTPKGELDRARAFCQEHGLRHIVIEFDELQIPGFRENPKDRCYHCKKAIFTEFCRMADELGMAWVADGSNVDDEGDYRPGLRALEEMGVRSPLREAGLTKADIRAISRELGLATWNTPSAACLASRFAYGEAITEQKLRRVGDAEEFLHGLGFLPLRVRVHGADGQLARIEVDAEGIARLCDEDLRAQVVGRLNELGFTYVALDLVGFRSGAMNEVLGGDA